MVRFIEQRTLRDLLQETKDAIHAGHIDAALAHCQSILASFPESLEAQCLLGEVYLAQGDLEEALHTFDWVLTNDPENVIAYCNRAIVSERLSDIDTALDCYQQAYELSRGDGQIRQEFTQLSAKVGQQGFVFSRAGLARLYMRGGLLPQAIQEWQVVLTAAPERLDARTGLLETYWREGFWDRVEELANQILQDVSGCLKALLLLAHVTAPKDMAQAQTLLRQVEALDPDLMMAQELFAAMFAHYPDDPFLKLLKKSPAVINTPPPPSTLPPTNSTPLATNLPQSGQTSITQIDTRRFPGTNPQWDNAQDWSTNATFLAPLPAEQLQHDHTSNGDQRQATVSDIEHSDLARHLSSDRAPRDSWPMQERFTPAAEYQPEPWEMLQNALQNDPAAEYQPEPWEMLQNALQNDPAAGYQLEPWESVTGQGQDQSESQRWEDQIAVSNGDGDKQSWEGQSEDPSLESSNSWVSPVGSYESQNSNWPATTQVNNPPSWLNMLTQVDHQEMTSTPLASFQSEEMPASPTPEPVTHQSVTSLPSSLWTQESESASSSHEDDELGFGPAWLKSLGATSLEEEIPHLEQATSSPALLFPGSEKPEQPAVNASHNAFEAQHQSQSDSWEIADYAVQSPAYGPPSASQKRPAVEEAHILPEVQEQVKASEPEPEPGPSISPSWQITVLEPYQQPSTAEHHPQMQLPTFDPEKTLVSNSQPEQLSNFSTKMEQDLVATLEELEQQLYAKGFVAMEPNSLSAIAQTEEAMTATTMIPLSKQSSQPMQESFQEQPLPSALAELDILLHQTGAEAETAVSSPVSTPNAADLPAEPLWFQTLHSTSTPESDAPIASPTFSTPMVSRPISQEMPKISQRQIEVIPEQNFEPGSTSTSFFSANPLNGHTNPLLDTELEMTMKRPAVRLQSILHSSVSYDTVGASSKEPVIERGEPPPVGKGREHESLNYQDRLLKGYQHQLVGDYDEAMHDYRLVIRSAPELLGDVINNLRALLKLAPKYSIGYRVLGDAYMRQGEYLQAMESYNNALTMTKKAKS